MSKIERYLQAWNCAEKWLRGEGGKPTGVEEVDLLEELYLEKYSLQEIEIQRDQALLELSRSDEWRFFTVFGSTYRPGRLVQAFTPLGMLEVVSSNEDYETAPIQFSSDEEESKLLNFSNDGYLHKVSHEVGARAFELLLILKYFKEDKDKLELYCRNWLNTARNWRPWVPCFWGVNIPCVYM